MLGDEGIDRQAAFLPFFELEKCLDCVGATGRRRVAHVHGHGRQPTVVVPLDPPRDNLFSDRAGADKPVTEETSKKMSG